jgi:hypothetical protein
MQGGDGGGVMAGGLVGGRFEYETESRIPTDSHKSRLPDAPKGCRNKSESTYAQYFDAKCNDTRHVYQTVFCGRYGVRKDASISSF